jgi:hypothetical protein
MRRACVERRGGHGVKRPHDLGMGLSTFSG